MRKLDAAAMLLVIVGALNWGLVALAEFDLVAEIFGLRFGQTNVATRIVYGLIGLSGLYLAVRASAILRAPERNRVLT
ncbi:MAG: DUF378 domain-containing protein [Actinomycetota bacterium]